MALLVLLKGRLVGGAKPNVPFVRRQFKIFCAVGKKLKHRRVGNECRLTRCPFVVSFLCLCSLVKMVYFFLVFSCRGVVVGSSFTLAANLLIEAVCSSKYNNFRCICAGSGAQISERVITVYFSLNCREMFNLHTKVAGIFDIKTAHF